MRGDVVGERLEVLQRHFRAALRELERTERERRALVDHPQPMPAAELARGVGVLAGLALVAARGLEDREHRERIGGMDALPGVAGERDRLGGVGQRRLPVARAIAEIRAQDERLVEDREATAATRLGDHVVEQHSHAPVVPEPHQRLGRVLDAGAVRPAFVPPHGLVEQRPRTDAVAAQREHAAQRLPDGRERGLGEPRGRHPPRAQGGVERGLGVARDDGHGGGVAQRDRTELRLRLLGDAQVAPLRRGR